MTTDPFESLMREGIPQGIPKAVDTGDGPTAWLMRVERQRLLWRLAHGEDEPLLPDLSESPATVDPMNATHNAGGFPVGEATG